MALLPPSHVDGAEALHARQGGHHQYPEYFGRRAVPHGDADGGVLLVPRISGRHGAERAGEHSEGAAGVDGNHGVHVSKLFVHVPDRDPAAERDHRGELWEKGEGET